MRKALRLAEAAIAGGDVPVGALVLGARGQTIATGYNMREAADHDPTAHAEIVALRQAASKLGTWHLDGCTLLVTLEPCTMCAAAAVHARVERIVFGAWDPKAGACGSLRDIPRDSRNNHRPQVIGGVLAPDCQAQLVSFFRDRRGEENASFS